MSILHSRCRSYFGRIAPTGRAADSKSVGCGFKPYCARHLIFWISLFLPILGYSSSEVSYGPVLMKWYLGGHHVSSDQVESRVLGAYSRFLFKHVYSPSLRAEVSALLRLETGTNRSLVLDEFAPKQNISLKNATLEWQPKPWVSLALGAINQKYLRSPLLVDTDRPFIGLLQEINHPISQNMKLYLLLQQSIPKEKEVFNRTGSIDSGTPSFNLGVIGVKSKQVSLGLGLFAFDHLSHTSAYRSQYMGNSVAEGTKETASFLYPFQGYNVMGQFTFPLKHSYDMSLNLQYLENIKAPRGRDQGLWGQIKVKSEKLELYSEYFSNESDTSPGVYNRRYYGHNNIKGFGAGGQINQIFENYSLKLNYRKGTLIDSKASQRLHQSDTQIIRVSLRHPFR